MDLYTLTRRPVLLPPVERKPVAPPETWAQMVARAKPIEQRLPRSHDEPSVRGREIPAAVDRGSRRCRVLAVVAERGPISLAGLMAALPEMTHKQMRSALDRLRQFGWSDCTRAGAVFVYAITPAGRAVLEGMEG